MSRINVCLACDNNYATLAGVSISSILKNSNFDDNLHFYILENNVASSNKQKIEALKKIKECEIVFVDVQNKERFENLYLPEKKGYLSISAYYRFLMSSLFPDLEKILYIDCDVIATTSLRELFDTNLTEFYAGMIKDTSCEANQKRLGLKTDEIYYNSGVLLANLKKWREDGIEKRLFDSLDEGLDDQDLLNIILKEKIKPMDETWNYQGKAKNYKEKTPPKLIHFITAYKPWRTGSKQSFNKEYFKALKGTPFDNFYDQYLRQFMVNIHKDRKFVHICFLGMKTRLRYKNA